MIVRSSMMCGNKECVVDASWEVQKNQRICQSPSEITIYLIYCVQFHLLDVVEECCHLTTELLSHEFDCGGEDVCCLP